MKKQNEDAPVNATGSAVPGTGSDVAHWKKNKKLKKAKKKLLPKYEVWIKAVEELGEGKNMKQFHDLWDDDKTPEEIAKIMKLDLTTVKKLMEEPEVEVPAAIVPDGTFASMPVFIVDPSDFAKCRFGKTKFSRWSRHIDTASKIGQKIHTYAKKNPNKSIIVQHEVSGHMLYLRKYSKKEGDKK